MGIVNQTLNITNGTATGTTTSFIYTELTTSSLYCVNATSNTGIDLANFTVDYEVGTITFITDNSYTSVEQYSNTSMTNCTYTYETGNYVEDATSRTLINQIPLLFAISFLLLVIGYVWFKYGNVLGDGL